MSDTSIICSLHFGQRSTLFFVITALTEDSTLAKIKTIKTITIHTERKDRSREVVLWVLILCEYLTPIQELIVGFLEEDSFHEVLRDENDELRYLRSVGRLKYEVREENKKWLLPEGIYHPPFCAKVSLSNTSFEVPRHAPFEEEDEEDEDFF